MRLLLLQERPQAADDVGREFVLLRDVLEYGSHFPEIYAISCQQDLGCLRVRQDRRQWLAQLVCKGTG